MKPSPSHRSSGRTAWLVASAVVWIAGCDLVLGIDDVSSAEGPDGGRRISASTADPAFRDASEDPDASADDDAGDERAR